MRKCGWAAAVWLCWAGSAAAGELTLGAGAGLLPDYPGADEFQFIPLAYLSYKSEWIGLRSNKLGLEADLVPWRAIEAGPVVRYDAGRDNVKDDVVRLLPDVESSAEVGGYLQAGLPLSYLGLETEAIVFAKVAYLTGVGGGHGGDLVEGALGVLEPLSEDLTLIATANASYMSDAYATSYFGIDAAGAAASGLQAFDADEGFKDVGATLIAIYEITDTVSATFIGSYTRLVEDAADSPIVADRGSADQIFVGVGLGYTFK